MPDFVELGDSPDVPGAQGVGAIPVASTAKCFTVDFNNVASGGRIKGSMRHASSELRPVVGERVYLHDHEGNECYARVSELRGQTVVFEPEFRVEFDDLDGLVRWLQGADTVSKGATQ